MRIKWMTFRDLSATLPAIARQSRSLRMGMLALVWLLVTCIGATSIAQDIGHVVHITIDGLGGDSIRELTANNPVDYPNFLRLETEGAFTHNARTDYRYTITMPNHASMLTGLPVTRPPGRDETVHHGYIFNVDPQPEDTLHNRGNPALSYVPGVFDVAHDNGLSTALYASKSKFILFDRSWDAENGAPDVTGPDNGPDKIDRYVLDETNEKAAVLINGNGADVNGFANDLNTEMYNYSFVSIRDPDAMGHASGWDSSEWNDAVKAADSYLGSIFNTIDNNAALANSTALIVTSDHGGIGLGHGGSSLSEDYVIPFYLWGPGVAGGADLYSLYPATRQNPGDGGPDYNAIPQPIRDGDAANLALDLLGLSPIPGSFMDLNQNPPPAGPAPPMPRAGVTHIYELNSTAADSLGGPDIGLANPAALGETGYSFTALQGATLADAINPSTYSIEMRFQIDTLGQGLILDYKNLENLASAPGLGALGTGAGGVSAPTLDNFAGPGFAPNEPTHLVVTRNDATDEYLVYANGVELLFHDDSIELTTLSGPNEILHVVPFWGPGVLDQVRIYEGVLSPEQVVDLFNGGDPPVVPEPSGIALGLIGILCLTCGWRRRITSGKGGL